MLSQASSQAIQIECLCLVRPCLSHEYRNNSGLLWRRMLAFSAEVQSLNVEVFVLDSLPYVCALVHNSQPRENSCVIPSENPLKPPSITENAVHCVCGLGW